MEQEARHDCCDRVSAVDAVRCIFLARELRKLGHVEAAERWEAQAGDWLGGNGRASLQNRPECPQAALPSSCLTNGSPKSGGFGYDSLQR